MRSRSPLCTTALIHVASKVEDAGKPPSQLQLKSREHAEKIAMGTLFSPVARLEVVQALSEFLTFSKHSTCNKIIPHDCSGISIYIQY